MADYQDIKGFNIQSKSSDPVPFAQEKSDNPWAGAWASGGNMNSARFLQGGAGAVHTAAIVFGGRNPSLSPGPNSNFTESYNGSSWTEVGDMNVSASYWAGMGTNTAALAVGGSPPATAGPTEQWNGASWTAKNALSRAPSSPQGTAYGMGNGTTTSALFYGGDEGANSKALTEEFNGTNWTEVGDLNTARGYAAGFGTNAEEAICAGGLAHPSGNLAITEKWNGTSWTEVGDLNTARLLYNTSATQSPSSDGLVYSGRNEPSNASFANTESWNGTSWTEVNDLATARRAGGGGGVATNAILSGGSPTGSPPYSNSNATEEWTFSGIPPTTTAVGYSDSIVGDMYYNSTTGQYKAIQDGGAPIGTWASGPNLNAACREGGGSGTSTSAINVGGYPYPMTAEQWNGSTWTTFTNMGTPRGKNASAGTYTNAITSAGATPSTPGYGTVNNNESWNGSAWSEIADLNSIREAYAMTAGGTNTAALVIGGMYSPGKLNVVEQWNGSSWTEVNEINTARALMAGAGTVTAGLISGGQSTADSADTETWNGTSWTEVNNLNTARKGVGGTSVSSTDGLIFGGQTTTLSANTESWNGTSWTEVSDLGTARYQLKGGGPSSTGALGFGGYTTTDVANTEEWTAGDFSIKTVTTS